MSAKQKKEIPSVSLRLHCFATGRSLIGDSQLITAATDGCIYWSCPGAYFSSLNDTDCQIWPACVMDSKEPMTRVSALSLVGILNPPPALQIASLPFSWERFRLPLEHSSETVALLCSDDLFCLRLNLWQMLALISLIPPARTPTPPGPSPSPTQPPPSPGCLQLALSLSILKQPEVFYLGLKSKCVNVLRNPARLENQCFLELSN